MRDTVLTILFGIVFIAVICKALIFNAAQPITYKLKKPLKPQIIINQTTQDTTYVYIVKIKQ